MYSELKKCSKCNRVKSVSLFSTRASRAKKKNNIRYVKSWCKECLYTLVSAHRERNKQLPSNRHLNLIQKKCARCKEVKSICHFSLSYSHKDGLTPWCKVCKARDDKKDINRGRRLVYIKEFFKTDLGKQVKLNHNRRRRDKERKLPSVWNNESYGFIVAKYGKLCFNCNSTNRIQVDHLFPLSSMYPLNSLNAIFLCSTCNIKKSDSNPYSFFSKEKVDDRFLISDFCVDFAIMSDIEFLIMNLHYLQTMPTAVKFKFKLTINGDVIGCCVFSSPSRQNIKAQLELSRFYIMDGTPKNTESFFLGKCLRMLKTVGFHGVIISFSDTTVGHDGVIYKATNWKFGGLTSKNYHYLTKNNIRIHKRQVWNRAKKNNLKECEQAFLEGLRKENEQPKGRWLYII